MKQVVIKNGKIDVIDNIAPNILEETVLVKVNYSVISTGTELSSISSRGNLLKTAMDRPDLVKLLLKKLKDSGIKSTYSLVQSKLSIPSELGYSCSGVVIESNLSDFKKGDRVAVAGAGIANHADFVVAPRNLATKIPDNVSLKDAAYTTISAIALQGVRRLDPKVGETHIVLGLGLLGQITCQILKANGCNVIGYDLNKSMVDLAKKQGFLATTGNLKEFVFDKTNGVMADGIIITAASKTKGIVDQAFSCVHKKSKVVIVGDVKLDFDRAEMYKKELDLLISTSYGPGRYDNNYELKGQDYPIGYVRWTENRNMQSVLDLVSKKQIDYSIFNTKVFKTQDAQKAYDSLKNRQIMVGILEYDKEKKVETKKIFFDIKPNKSKINVGLIGVGNFVSATHIPNLAEIIDYKILGICSNEGLNAGAISEKVKARYYTTDYKEIINDKDIDLVFIGTRHDSHGKLVIEALKKGKHIFVEKPLCVNKSELQEIESYLSHNRNQILFIGHNRRYAPLIKTIKEEFNDSRKIITYRVNAGYIPQESWVQDKKQGTRILGEMVHFFDLFNYLTDSDIKDIKVSSIGNTGNEIQKSDNLIVTIEYQNGDLANLLYTSIGSNEMPKERLEIFGSKKSAVLDDYKELTIFSNHKKHYSTKQDKGHKEELIVLKNAIKGGQDISREINQGILATKIAFDVLEKINRDNL